MKKIMLLNIFLTVFFLVMSIGNCWGMEGQLTISTLLELNTAILEQNKILEEQNESFSIHQKQLLSLLQHREEKNKLLCAWIQNMQETIDGQNPQLEDLRSKLEALETKEQERNKAFSKFIGDEIKSGLEGITIIFNSCNDRLDEVDQKTKRLDETSEKYAAQAKEISELKTQLARLQGSVDVLSQNRGNSSGSVHLSVSGTGGSVTTEQTTEQTVEQQTNQKTSVEEKISFFRTHEKGIKAAFCALLLLGSYCKSGREAVVAIGGFMALSVYFIDKYKEALKRAVVIASGSFLTVVLLAIAFGTRDYEDISAMFLLGALITGGTTASQV